MPRSLDNRPFPAEGTLSVSGEEPLDLRTLFDAHYQSIWRLLRRFGVAEGEVDDAAQEVFWVAARRLADIQPGRAPSFLYGVALRVAKSQHRKRPVLAPAALDEVAELVDDGPSPEEQLERRQARRLLDGVLNRMPLDLRTVFVLYELEALEVTQIAEIEGIPVGTAASRLRRAREEFAAIAKRLRAALSAKGALR